MLTKFRDELERRGASPNTVQTYLRNLRLFIQWYEQTTNETFDNKITVFDGREYRAYLCTVKRQKPTSVNAKLGAVQQYADFLYTQGLQEKTTIEKQKAVVAHGVTVLDKSSLYKVRRWAHAYAAPRDIAIFELLLNTGLRESELTALTLDDLELSERKGKVIIRNGKGGKYRELPLNLDARTALQGYLAVRQTSIDSHVFLGQRGALTRNAVYKVIQHIGAKGADVELYPHMLRHQCFTAMAKGGTDLTTIADMAGHSDVKLTASYYVSTSTEDRQNAVDRLEF